MLYHTRRFYLALYYQQGSDVISAMSYQCQRPSLRVNYTSLVWYTLHYDPNIASEIIYLLYFYPHLRVYFVKVIYVMGLLFPRSITSPSWCTIYCIGSRLTFPVQDTFPVPEIFPVLEIYQKLQSNIQTISESIPELCHFLKI